MIKQLFSKSQSNIDWGEELRGMVSLLLFLGVTALLLQSVSLAVMIVASLGFHELGHIAALAIRHIPWKLRFGLAGAWTESPKAVRTGLSNYTNSLIHLAGPLFSLLYAFLALVIHRFWLPDQPQLMQLANLNAQLALFNLLPLGEASDGGKFLHKAFASLNEKDDGRLMRLAISWGLGVVCGTLYVGIRQHGATIITPILVGYVLMVIWLFVGMLVEKKEDNPAEAALPQAMSYPKARVLMAMLGGMLLISTALAFITPFWLSPGHILEMINSFLTWLVR